MATVTAENEHALSLKEAAELLGVSYETVCRHRGELGFFKVGAQWRVWPSTLQRISQMQYNESRPARTGQEQSCQSESAVILGTLTSARQAEEEFDALLKQRTGRRRKSITTN